MYFYCPLIQAKDPRLRVTTLSVRLMDLRETDEGTYSVSFGQSGTRDIVNLKILGENVEPNCKKNGISPVLNNTTTP